MLTDVPDDEKNPEGKGLHFARYRVISYIIGERKKIFLMQNNRQMHSLEYLGFIWLSDLRVVLKLSRSLWTDCIKQLWL